MNNLASAVGPYLQIEQGLYIGFGFRASNREGFVVAVETVDDLVFKAFRQTGIYMFFMNQAALQTALQEDLNEKLISTRYTR